MLSVGSISIVVLYCLTVGSPVSACSGAKEPRFIYGTRLIRIPTNELEEIYNLCHYRNAPYVSAQNVAIREEEEQVGLEERISGGDDTNVGHFPSAVSIRMRAPSWAPNMLMQAFCGGTLVTWRHVITSATCFKEE